MSLDEIKVIADMLRKQGKMRFVDPAKEEDIANFEKNNSVTLPLKYKEWLSFSDGGHLFTPAGVQLYGVSHKPIIDVNDQDRPNDSYIVIGSLCFGDPVLFEKKSGKIAIYNHEKCTIESDEVFTDFISFMTNLHELLGIGE